MTTRNDGPEMTTRNDGPGVVGHAASVPSALLALFICLSGCSGPDSDNPPVDGGIDDAGRDFATAYDAWSGDDAASRDTSSPDAMADDRDSGPPSDATEDTSPSTDAAPDGSADVEQDAEGMYVEALGDPNNPESCDTICAADGRRCDGQYEHFALGPIGGLAEYDDGDGGAGLACDDVPDETMAGPFGNEMSLTAIRCYCAR